MPCVVDDEKGVLFIVERYKLRNGEVGLSLRASREPAVNLNAFNVVIVNVFKNVLESLDL